MNAMTSTLKLNTQTINVACISIDQEIVSSYQEALNKHNINLIHSDTFESNVFQQQNVDLVIYGSYDPLEINGWTLSKQPLNKSYPTMWFNRANNHIDKIIALETVADYVVDQGVQSDELRALIRSNVRRCKEGSTESTEERTFTHTSDNVHSFRDFSVNFESETVYDKHGEKIKLNGSETSLLFKFLNHKNEVLDRQALAKQIFNDKAEQNERLVDVRVYRLRKKLEKLLGISNLIRTAHSKGYIFVPVGA